MDKTAGISPPPHPRVRRPRRLLLFVHYNKWGELAEYVVYLLKHVRNVFSRVVLISNSPLSETTRMPLEGLYDDFFQRENTGFDFLAWKEALAREGRERLAAYDSVTLMNDTCFGPLFDLEGVYRRMEAQGADFWGLSNHRGTRCDDFNLLAKDNYIAEHIQSYFLCFSRKAFLSSAFHSFWKSVENEKSVTKVIRNYEIPLTKLLNEEGLSSSVVCDTTNMRSVPNIALYEPLLLLEHIPFIKIKAFFAHCATENAYLFSVIQQKYHRPVGAIRKHLERHFSPEISLKVMDHSLENMGSKKGYAATQRIGLHIHAFYTDILHKILIRLIRYVKEPIDIFFTTDCEKKATEIQCMLDKDFRNLTVKGLQIIENRGRDIWPWLKISTLLRDYDFAGHLHTKKSPLCTLLFSNLWFEELLDCLLGRFSQVKRAFSCDSRLGIVIPDIPSAFRFPPFPYDYDSDIEMKKLLPQVWKRLGCRREIDFSHMRALVFPYGNMFWYRPAALEPMWRVNWNSDDMPDEPLPRHGTICHALERLPVYVSWDQGYDFRIARQKHITHLGFQEILSFSSLSGFIYSNRVNSSSKTGILHAIRAKLRHRFDASS
ncbi:rhamnan synthesis F family protein [uncultured Desulfovibrio sp.]|uniref:rhamnan synthesis F family protein n=2 Tax=uncultured Desulfovibrio sp. TaxID=167968 RepID=UPI0025CCC07C|nr:rhamnan synthesis F family protein [uncultured Desulfovibrio sp.]